MTTSTEAPTTDVSIVLPCLDEAESLPQCLAMAREALETLAGEGLAGEIVVSDNGSRDGSVRIAEEAGARVTHCARKGYGSALLHGIRTARGRYIVMGDADASYDFREAVPMVRKLRDEGLDLCMGNRFRGEIQAGAMPWKNRYLGNPVLSSLLNLFYRSGLGDAHCGLRAFTKEAFERMRLSSPGMEFASEMVVKTALLGLRADEVPVTLRPDARGRPPHLRPWRDGWRHLRFLLMLSPFWMYVLPSVLLLTLSLLLGGALLATPPGEVLRLGPLWFGDHWMVLLGAFFGVGYSGLLLGLATWLYSVRRGYRRVGPFAARWMRAVSLENALLLAAALLLAGGAVFLHVLAAWSAGGFGPLAKLREMVVASTLLATGLKTVFWGFILAFLLGSGEPGAFLDEAIRAESGDATAADTAGGGADA